MKREHEDFLRERYSKLFENYLYKRHIDCGDGWFHIVTSMLQELSQLDKEINVIQIKQKFAALTTYVDPWDDDVVVILNRATDKAGNTCELCGWPCDGATVFSNYRWTAHEECLLNREWRDREDYNTDYQRERILLELVEYDEHKGWLY